MLAINPAAESYNGLITIEKHIGRENASDSGAFSLSLCPDFHIKVSRRIGVSRVFLHLTYDETGEKFRLPFNFVSTDYTRDFFTLSPDIASYCKDNGHGLFFYKIEFKLDDAHSLFTSSVNNVDFSIVYNSDDAKQFRLLVYSDGFSTPEWAKSVVMYHIFIDRFYRGSVEVQKRVDSVCLTDWDNGIPEYPEYNGAPIANNSFFGGTIYGVTEKLGYLSELGVGLIYLSPIFKAYSNHKYDTGDYDTVDEMFGGDDAFDELIEKAHRLGIRVILDGVFNHTGDDSRYFNRYGKYDCVGAYQSQDSQYSSWYRFTQFPDKYDCWWGIPILPKLQNTRPELQEFFLGDNGIVRKWLKRGTCGWRLDVADELPQEFLDRLRRAAKAENPDALIIGEVWENAADKVAYGERRRYFSGLQLDSVMNYPVKNAIIDYVKSGDADGFYNSVTDIYSSYPKVCADVLMNILGTHDTERILTVLGGESSDGRSNSELAHLRMNDDQRKYAIKLLKLAAVLQFTLPGIPCIYYGDETGMEGYHDPFCRMPYPWGRENHDLQEFYKRLCRIRNLQASLHGGLLKFTHHSDGIVVYKRLNKDKQMTVCINMSDSDYVYTCANFDENLLDGSKCKGEITLASHSAAVLA